MIKMLIIVAVIAIAHHWYINEFPDEEELTIATFALSISLALVGVAALIVGKRYSSSEVFGKAYIALGIGFFFFTAGDLTYIYYGWFTEESPYPSFADVFFLMFYPFAAYHLIKNIKYIKKKLSWGSKFGVVLVSATIVGIFGYMSIDVIEEEPFEFYFGLLFVSVSAIIFSLALLGATVFQHSILGSAWLILVGGLFILTVADVWYYYLEIVEGYAGDHLVNTLWIMGNVTILCALYKHKQTI